MPHTFIDYNQMISFGSDNHSGIHPQILAAIAAANNGHVPAYGDDPYTRQAEADLAALFGVTANEVYFVFNGTGANCTGLWASVAPFHSVLCADTAHIHVDECGAPERLTGCKITPVAPVNGKLTPEALRPYLHGWGFEHHSQPRVVSITQTTELGTLYTREEVRALADLAHEHGMLLHMDGARFAQAVVGLGCTPLEVVGGVDVLSFGGTKNGMMLGEAVVFLNAELAKEFKYLRKQSMQLCSKMRFVGAQFSAYLQGGLWLELAAHARQMAQLLYERVKDLQGVEVTRAPEANAVFAIIAPELRERLLEHYCFYLWDHNTGEVRWMCSFDTTPQDIEAFVAALVSCR